MFINYENGEIRILSYRKPTALMTDLEDILKAIDEEREETLVIQLDDVKDALEDGELLGSMDVSQDAIEHLHAEIGE